MVTLVTVTFSKDIYVMLLQAYSLKLFVKNPITHYVYVQDDDIPIEKWHNLLAPIYKKHNLVLLNKIYDLFNHKNHGQGWTEQQYIKLKLSASIPSDYILNLDSKDFFCFNGDINEIFQGHEGTIGSIHDLYSEDLDWVKAWRPWINLIDRTYNLRSPAMTFPVTPFVFKKENLQKLINTVNLSELFLAGLKETDPLVSEYILYNYFADQPKVKSNWNNIHENGIRVTQPIKRRELDNSIEYKETTRQMLLDMGFPKNIVDPAVDLTSQKARE